MGNRIAILGAGLTGLVTARLLQRAGHEVTVFEAGDKPGGYMQTGRREGWQFELGPNTLAADEETVAVLRDAGVADVLIQASEAAKKRFIVNDGMPVALPGSPPALLKSSLFSWTAKMQVFAEPLRPRRRSGEDESVADFVRRRLNGEWLETAVGPFVSGVFAVDPEKLSLRHAFPRMHALERDYGGLIRGAAKRGKAMARPLYSTSEGLGELARRLAEGLPIQYGLKAQKIRREGAGWLVELAGPQHFDAVVLTAGPQEAAALVASLDADLAASLQSVMQPTVAVVHHGYRTGDVAHPVDGFGMLFPRRERTRTLGTLFPSSMFPGRAPEGHHLLTSFLGGALDPEAAVTAPEAFLEAAVAENGRVLGITAPPVFSEVRIVPHAIAQYNVGHGLLLERLTSFDKANPGLFLAGNYRGGVGLNDRILAAARIARRLEEEKL
jgi:oxygen-dependent protoporphyrinogen oxidase